jgi:hypothetical protein
MTQTALSSLEEFDLIEFKIITVEYNDAISFCFCLEVIKLFTILDEHMK